MGGIPWRTFNVCQCLLDIRKPSFVASLGPPAMEPFWKPGKNGSLSPWSQSVVVALFKLTDSKKLNLSYNNITKEVRKVGGGHPSKQAVADLHARIQEDKT